jgi:chromosomal replication initiation ATPase DnaA
MARLVGHRPSEARRAYRALMNRPDETEAYPNRAIQGDQEFVARMVRSSEVSLPRELVVRDVAEAVAEAFGSSVNDLRSHEHGSARLRAAVAYLSREEGEISVARTAKFLRRSESAVSRAVRELEASLVNDVELRRRLARVARLIRDAAPVRVPAATINPFRNVRLRE